jgi:hypothetical protein
MSETERADFVFLVDPAKKQINIAELKKPSEILNDDHRRQLADYLDFTERFHSAAEVTGVLIGAIPNGGLKNPDKRITIRGWDEVFLECRAAYIALLASMLEHADLDPSDERIKLVAEFGGTAVWELLEKLAGQSERLKNLMDDHKPLLLGSSTAL